MVVMKYQEKLEKQNSELREKLNGIESERDKYKYLVYECIVPSIDERLRSNLISLSEREYIGVLKKLVETVMSDNI